MLGSTAVYWAPGGRQGEERRWKEEGVRERRYEEDVRERREEEGVMERREEGVQSTGLDVERLCRGVL